ncbi:hypothetical protein D3C87_1147570 [compost metagenome]
MCCQGWQVAEIVFVIADIIEVLLQQFEVQLLCFYRRQTEPGRQGVLMGNGLRKLRGSTQIGVDCGLRQFV